MKVMGKSEETLAAYEVVSERGFLPESDPLIEMPALLMGWGEIAAELPKLLVANKLAQAVESMPVISVDNLKTRGELERAMLALSFIGHGYVFSGDPTPSQLPDSLAVPWYQTAKQLGRPPILSYASYALHNWRRISKSEPIQLGNIALIQNFLGGLDEEWFVLVHVDLEAKAGGALTSLFPAQEAAARNDATALEKELENIEQSLKSVYDTLLRMPEGCDPYIYYHRVRPYIHGWKDHPLFPNGLIYAGVTEYGGIGQRFRGETGAQSSIIPALDAALSVRHKQDPMRVYLDEMRDYMPPKHRAFIEAIESHPSVREFVTSQGSSNKSLHDVYNQCINWIELFRTKHLEYARDYIFKQQQRGSTNPSAVGTGGTPFMPYLQKHRDETAEHKLPNSC